MRFSTAGYRSVFRQMRSSRNTVATYPFSIIRPTAVVSLWHFHEVFMLLFTLTSRFIRLWTKACPGRVVRRKTRVHIIFAVFRIGTTGITKFAAKTGHRRLISTLAFYDQSPVHPTTHAIGIWQLIKCQQTPTYTECGSTVVARYRTINPTLQNHVDMTTSRGILCLVSPKWQLGENYACKFVASWKRTSRGIVWVKWTLISWLLADSMITIAWWKYNDNNT